MEEQKYYTPAPEDIRPGLIYEYKKWADDENYQWDKRILPENGSVIQNVLERLKKGTRSVRVPYLTAEQIEAEGWNKDSSEPSMYRKPFYSLRHWPSRSHLIVTQYAEDDGESSELFSGKCRCINDLRLICKLLGI